jgi:branched-chain amino acid transport system permease protein
VNQFGQAIITGLLLSGVYALMSSGLVLTFGVMRIINLAQGAFIVLGAYLTYIWFTDLGVDPFLSVLLSLPLMFAVGVAFEVLLIRPLKFKKQSLSVLMTWGMALGIEGALVYSYGSDLRAIRPGYVDNSWNVGGYTLVEVRVYAFVLSLAALFGLYLILQRSRIGRAIRATAENPEAAKLLGINSQRVSALAFGIGTATAAIAGAIFGLVASFSPANHQELIGRLLTIVVLGGLGSFRGALAAALLLGVSESLVQVYVSPAWGLFPFYILLLAIVAVRPQGLFGEGEVRTV